jgi:hypothetical protein
MSIFENLHGGRLAREKISALHTDVYWGSKGVQRKDL